MTKQETAEILAYLYADHDKAVPEMKVLAWHDRLKSISKEDGWAVAKVLITTSTFGPPKLSDFYKRMNAMRESSMPESLMLTGREALVRYDTTKLLTADAAAFAERVSPKAAGQYKSIEDLEQAERIQKAIWEREFIERYDRKRSEALRLVRSGKDPKTAIATVIMQGGLIDMPQEKWAALLDKPEVRRLEQ